MMTIDNRNARSFNAKYTPSTYFHMTSEPHCYSAFEELATPVHARFRLP
jgi:hypothetical protein